MISEVLQLFSIETLTGLISVLTAVQDIIACPYLDGQKLVDEDENNQDKINTNNELVDNNSLDDNIF
ncbi:hypothetical protein C2G38_2159916 [Gigaspora rosea]|uniref:Uncharacterized protein n=1 Tax=Gigaspora rosea TaxID=44941 RepID=A0A397W0X5_9GLOM|nr:hypothetical protein C2G38_2159916 [Gigaspora rosea]